MPYDWVDFDWMSVLIEPARPPLHEVGSTSWLSSSSLMFYFWAMPGFRSVFCVWAMAFRLKGLERQKAPRDIRRGFLWIWLRGQDLNLRPSGYEPDELPGCSTPRYIWNGNRPLERPFGFVLL